MLFDFFHCFFQSSHSNCLNNLYRLSSVTLIVARKAPSSSVRTQFFGITSFSPLMKLRGNFGNSRVVSEDIDRSGIFVNILVVNPTGFR